ncbi:hypothetical protein NMG60_11007093 [Bertholletia excelsa]
MRMVSPCLHSKALREINRAIWGPLNKTIISTGEDAVFHIWDSEWRNFIEETKELDHPLQQYNAGNIELFISGLTWHAFLKEPSQSKDHFFAFELDNHQHTSSGGTTLSAWQRMVDAVKVYMIYLLI